MKLGGSRERSSFPERPPNSGGNERAGGAPLAAAADERLLLDATHGLPLLQGKNIL